MAKEAMSPKHKLFCDTYLANDKNALQAYLEVYKCAYSTARSNGSNLLTKTDISKYIEKALKKKGEELQQEFGISAKGQIEKLLFIENLAIEEKNPNAAIKSIEAQNALADLNPANKSIVEHKGEIQPIYIDKKEFKP